MEKEQQTSEYQPNDADALVGELFSGGISVEEAIERLRNRLLDLSARNRLLNYRFPKARCIQIADKPSINLVFDRLYTDGRGVPFKHVPEPSPEDYEGKRPEARHWAQRMGIDTSFDFPPNKSGSNGHRLHGLQTLLFPAELERQLRKIAGEAKTAVEETGTNMLFLVFGFLEFYDSEDSEKPMLAPLLSLPVTLVRGAIDTETRTYQYTVQHNGEDLTENHTLREKMRRDFVLSMPDFGEEDDPEAYFSRIEQAVRKKRRWRVRRQITLGMFSFGKLAIWADLDTKKNQGLPAHALIRSVFSGGSSGDDCILHAEDYKIDERPEASQPLIYDADSSQHSAIIDVLLGKNLVINGPPGTGKSQTITNVIASAISKGKKVLFVSEKLAALEVVRHRLNHAGLGHFCLELHSHKTQKKKFLEDIQARIEARFPAPSQLQAKLAILQQKKTELARYAELMGSKVGNALELTVNELFWAAERRRQELGDLSAQVNAIGFPDASRWTHDEIESKKSKLAGLAEIYDSNGGYSTQHLWWGFRPSLLAPSDDEAIARSVSRALECARDANSAANDAAACFGLKEQPDVASAASTRSALDGAPPVPAGLVAGLLERLFDQDSDPKGLRSSRLLSDVAGGVTRSRALFASAARHLATGCRLSREEMAGARELSQKQQLSTALMSADIGAALESVAALERATEAFESAARSASPRYAPLGQSALVEFVSSFEDSFVAGLSQITCTSVAGRASAVSSVVAKLNYALGQVSEIAARRGLPFDSTPDAVARLADPDGLCGLAKGVSVDHVVLADARRFACFALGDKSVDEIIRLRSLLEKHLSEWRDALKRCRSAAERSGLAFDASTASISELACLAQISVDAPSDLLEYRSPSFGHPRTAELIAKTRSALKDERDGRSAFGETFYLDALPPSGELKAAITSLRSKEGLLAFFDGEWRKSKKLHAGLSRAKRKLNARERADELTGLTSWIEAKDSFLADSEIKNAFGGLFRGLETDPEMIARLYGWYQQSKTRLAECPGLSDKVDLTSIGAEKLAELASKAETIRADAEALCGAEATVKDIFGADMAGFRDATAKSWDSAIGVLEKAVESLGTVTVFFAARADSKLAPREALRLMEAKAELSEASAALSSLLGGETAIRRAAGGELETVASLAVGPWDMALKEIFQRTTKAASVAEMALVFGSSDVPLAFALAFAKSKLALDSAWESVAAPAVWNRFQNWQELANGAREVSAAARGILEKFAGIAREGVSASRVFDADTEESEAKSILTRFSESPEVRSLLGEVFSGVETDLEGLATTHGWGAQICALDVPTQVKRKLLSREAADALETAALLFGRIDNGCRGARESLESLNHFGAFSWDDWQGSARRTPGRDLPEEIAARLSAPAENPGAVLPWSKYLFLRMLAHEEGLGDFVVALEESKLPSHALAPAFELAAYQSIGRAVYQAFPELSRFNGSSHEKTRDAYRVIDAEIIALTGRDFASQIERRTKVPEGQRGSTVGDYTEMHLLRREINKQRRHIPIRQLVKRAGRALLELKPCFMMGPLSVAQYLEQGALKFDLVVMDEASQLRPEEALGAIARGTQLVVVGDPKQLPPTSFFDRMLDAGDDEDEDEAPAAITGMESILDICQQLFTPVRSLRWHYRSHHESLIAFSNHHFYKNLVVFPSPYARNPGLGVKYRYVRGGVYKDRQNIPEAQRIVDAILEHMLKRPDESLGVVTLNQAQRELIEELLDKKLKTFAEGAEFMAHWEAEGWPFFVKNLENVQGDERDVIYISTTFGKAVGTDKVRQNFGPISRPDGWRRLNVLFTRSKRRIELFTSMAPEDIVVDEKTPLGTKALRDYLDFAKRGTLVTTDEGVRDPDSDFEISVAKVLTSMGYEVKPQLGVAGFFIDMAVRNPDRPGEFLAGIECDGATYHSGFSVRDRDRIRQEILEALGWRGKIYRIWSTDWFYNPRQEAERLRSFLDERRRLSSLEEFSADDHDIALFEEADPDQEATAEAAEIAEEIADSSIGAEDLFVEVGDRVTYCLVDDPDERHSILIVDSESNVKMGLVNEKAPLAQALLGLSPGDEGLLSVPGGRNRAVRVLKLHRKEELLK